MKCFESCKLYNHFCTKKRCYGYLPKEKLMENKVIFESEEEIKKFIDDCVCIRQQRNSFNIDFTATFFHCKDKGYIRKSPVEEAEQYYKDWYNDKESNPEIVMDKMSAAIQYLKQQLKNKE